MKLSEKKSHEWTKPLLRQRRSNLQKLFDDALKNGFTLRQVGKQMGGNYSSNIYKLKNASDKNLIKVETAIKQLKRK